MQGTEVLGKKVWGGKGQVFILPKLSLLKGLDPKSEISFKVPE